LYPNVQVDYICKRVSEMMRRVVMQRIEGDFISRRYHSMLACVGCKLIMNVSASRFARENGIDVLFDGYAERQNEYPEQTPAFMEAVKEIYAAAGLTYVSPLYDFLSSKEQVNQTLDQFGYRIAKQEPICMLADSFSKADPDEVSSYIAESISLIRTIDADLHC
jgi:PP-loop superfamily ATP-utilizing enzyme